MGNKICSKLNPCLFLLIFAQFKSKPKINHTEIGLNVFNCLEKIVGLRM